MKQNHADISGISVFMVFMDCIIVSACSFPDFCGVSAVGIILTFSHCVTAERTGMIRAAIMTRKFLSAQPSLNI